MDIAKGFYKGVVTPCHDCRKNTYNALSAPDTYTLDADSVAPTSGNQKCVIAKRLTLAMSIYEYLA